MVLDAMKAIVANPKTSFAGLALLAVTAAYLLGRLDTQQYLVAFGALSGAGLMLAKDGEKR